MRAATGPRHRPRSLSSAQPRSASFPPAWAATTWTKTASASTLAPLSRIGCASLAISCPTCEPPPEPKPADYEVRKLEPVVEAGLQ